MRDEALLAIVMVTNEDDCSAAPGVGPNGRSRVNTNDMNLASQLGPPANFRCNEFGHSCGGAHPNRNAPGNDVNATVNYSACMSNDAEGYLVSVADTAARGRRSRVATDRLLVAVIAGPKTPYR